MKNFQETGTFTGGGIGVCKIQIIETHASENFISRSRFPAKEAR